ncbi:MAG TPA: hypothetical protein VN867_08210 [Candidatus Binataceae bacterium]|nr:hypothetical protein [Candidatus Binataceae bacterium]
MTVDSMTAGAAEIWRIIFDAHQRRMLEEIASSSIVYLDSVMTHFHRYVKLQ